MPFERKAVVLALLPALLLAGCATAPAPTNSGAIVAATPDWSAPDTTQNDATNVSEPDPDNAAANNSDTAPTAESLPPPDGLWERVRRGFEFESSYAHKPLVRKWVQFYITHLDHLLGAAKRAKPYLWHIVEALDKRGMPMELALLPIVESAYKAGITSYAGAAGLWQFIPITADRFGLTQNWWYDARHALLPSTRAALDYLSWLHGQFNNWLLALAAYNAGAGRVSEAIEQARALGQPTNFWHLNLPTQTKNFVPKLLALREILLAPQKFAIDWPELPNKQLTAAVPLPIQVEFDRLAEMIGMSAERLRELNPAYRRWATAPTPEHKILVPIEKADNLRVALANAEPGSLVTRRAYRVSPGDTLSAIAQRFDTSVAKLRLLNELESTVIHPGDKLLLPSGASAGAVASSPARMTYTVASGETLWSIAQRFGTSVATLRRWNALGGNTIYPGQELLVPAGQTRHRLAYEVERGDTLWSIANSFDVSVAQLRTWNNLGRDHVLLPGEVINIRTETATHMVTYEVKPGDSLWGIASRFSVQVAQIKDWNGLADTVLHPGDTLRIIVDATS